MALLTILFSLALEKFLPPLEELRSLTWFDDFSQWLRERLRPFPRWQGFPALLLVTVLPALAVGLAYLVFHNIHGMLGFVFSVAVLTYCLGARNPFYVAHQYQEALERQDAAAAREKLQQLLGGEPPADEAKQAAAAVRTLLVQYHERLLAVLFWLVLLGPFGALLYRLAAEVAARQRRNPDAHYPEYSLAAARLLDILDWLPARLTAFCYAAMGNFMRAMNGWEEIRSGAYRVEGEPTLITPESHELLVRAGFGALEFDTQRPEDLQAVREAFALCLRSLIICLVLLALLTLASWIA
jgi:membrane protein required for beta-lactamase induction